MSTNPWWMSAKLYELYIDKFAGDIKGLTAALDYFPRLGVNTLHLLPHYPSPMVDDGYDVSDYRNVRPELGTLSDFKVLLDEAHARGLRVVIDFVLNHTSREHPWFLEARADKASPMRAYYIWSDTGEELKAATNAFPDMKQSNWIYNSDTDDYYFATFYPGQPDLNWDNPDVFEAMVGHMEFWAELGVDGFRLDAAPFLIKREHGSYGLPEVHAIIKKIRARLEKKYPEVILLPEAAESVEDLKRYFGNGDECHLVYHFPLMEQLWMALVTGEHKRVEQMVAASRDIPAGCQWATFLRNHDDISVATLSEEDRLTLMHAIDPMGRYPFNKGRTTCVRVATAFNADRAQVLKAMELLYRTPGAPIMYYGDEIGQLNVHAPAFMLDTRRHVRGEFEWDKAHAQMADPESLWAAIARTIHFSSASDLTRDTDVGAPRKTKRTKSAQK